MFQHDGSSEGFLRDSMVQTSMDVGPELPNSEKWYGRVSSPWLERILLVSNIIIFIILHPLVTTLKDCKTSSIITNHDTSFVIRDIGRRSHERWE